MKNKRCADSQSFSMVWPGSINDRTGDVRLTDKMDLALENHYAIFDMDGTLIDSNPWLSKVSGRYFAKRGVPPNAEYENLAAGMIFSEFCQAIRDYCGDRSPLETTIDEINGYTSEVYTKCDIPAKPYVREYLEILRQNGVRMCVGSATEKNRIESVLHRLALRDYFEFIVSTAEVGCGKSKPDLYIEAAKRFGSNDYTGITVYEDFLPAMKSAKSAGFRVVGIYDKVGERQIEAAKEACDVFSYDFEALYRRLVNMRQRAE